MAEYRLSNKAEDDLEDIFLFSLHAFGERQAIQYVDDLHRCLELLADNPRMGRRAAGFDTEVHRHEHQSHVIFYEIDDNGIFVITVIHKRRLVRITT
ncbi:type II toxin-antitoxin system RelE/ParE family toxin [Neorhizobium sp. SOG26]|uniref:type II toxin-antitoxin system RelE/ParE family toxin n=1 Tax=Neorhizobium sp. SOG26 TaxID=2060726 RepID=UPI0018FF71CD|nr:type II toxin-antitoxin system RelE/ParE family toxin [Neorhizobium sp. SOG26]